MNIKKTLASITPDSDLAAMLTDEKAGKNRVTLTRELEERIAAAAPEKAVDTTLAVTDKGLEEVAIEAPAEPEPADPDALITEPLVTLIARLSKARDDIRRRTGVGHERIIVTYRNLDIR